MATSAETQREMLEPVADAVVEFMYQDLDDQVLRDMLIHGKEFPPAPVVEALNKSIQNELDRRQREREELAGHR